MDLPASTTPLCHEVPWEKKQKNNNNENLSVLRVIQLLFLILFRILSKTKMCILKFACLSYHSFRSFYKVDGGKSFDTYSRSSEPKVASTPPLRADFRQ